MNTNTISPKRASGCPTTAVSRISGQSVKLGNHNGDDGCHEAFRTACFESKALVAGIAAGYVRNHKPDWERWWIAELDRQCTGMQVGSGVLRHRIGLPVAHFILKSFKAPGPDERAQAAIKSIAVVGMIGASSGAGTFGWGMR